MTNVTLGRLFPFPNKIPYFSSIFDEILPKIQFHFYLTTKYHTKKALDLILINHTFSMEHFKNTQSILRNKTTIITPHLFYNNDYII